jgi:hypothetical protein
MKSTPNNNTNSAIEGKADNLQSTIKQVLSSTNSKTPLLLKTKSNSKALLKTEEHSMKKMTWIRFGTKGISLTIMKTILQITKPPLQPNTSLSPSNLNSRC